MSKKLAFSCVMCLAFFFLGKSVFGQMNKEDHSDISLHCQHFPLNCLQEDVGELLQQKQMAEKPLPWTPHESGQSIFGAISEINEIAEREDINWANVDMDALWEHLKDMNSLMIYTSVEKQELSNGLVMNVTGDEKSTRAMDEMIPAHSNFLMSVRPNWDISFRKIEKGYSIRVVSEDNNETLKIKALGFSGFMVQNDHHGAHHLGIALGQHVH